MALFLNSSIKKPVDFISFACMVNNSMRGLFVKSFACAALALSIFPRLGHSEVIIQYFETRWDEMYQRLPEMAEIGYESIWTPPPGKSPIGGPYPYAYGGNVGYNSFDRFDLGDTPQRGHWETRYGSRTSLRNLVDNAHQSDIKIYPDIVFNHTGNGPDFRTYPGMVPQDFHVWADASQPGGFKRADRMYLWDAANGTGGTLHQELVSLMDIVLEFDNRFQIGGANSVGYAVDPTPFVRHPGDAEKYPYFDQTGYLAENSRQFITRWINWLGYAMDYDGVRLDAPKHVYKDFFGLPNQSESLRNQSFIYNIQRNFKERRLGRSPNTTVQGMNFDEMYQNDIRRDSALIYSEFFIGGVGEVDYWRNPSDPNWGIKTRYLDFPRKKGMMNDAFNNGNLAALSGFSGFSAEEGVMFAHSHDEGPPSKLELAYAYILTRVGVPVVYFSGNNLAQSQIGRTAGKNTWMEKGYDYALGDTVNGFQSTAVPNLIYIHNQFARGKEYNRWSEGDFFAFERYDDLDNDGNPDAGEGLLLVALNDSGSDQTRTVQTAFSAGTKLKDYTGRNLDPVTVSGSGQAVIRVPGGGGQGWVCYAPFNAEAPSGVDPLQFSGSGVSTIPWTIPAGRDGTAKPVRNIVRLTGDTVQIDIRYSNAGPQQNGEIVDNVMVKWGQGRDLNGNGTVDQNSKAVTTGGFESAIKIADGHYRLTANLTNLPEGLHTIKARVFNGRTGKPALFQTFTETVYLDRHGPDLTFENLVEGETLQGARVVTIQNSDRTLHNLTYSIDGGAAQSADEVIRGKWRIHLSGLNAGNHSITLIATEADYGSSRSVINTSALTRNFTIDTNGSSIAINHANNATLTEPFFKTTVTVPAGTATNNVKLFWNGYEQIGLAETAPGSGIFETFFNGRYRQGGVDKLFTGAFINGPHFFEAVVNPGTANENRISRRVVFNLFGQNLHDSDGDGLPDEIELSGFLNGTNPGPDQAWPGDNSKDLIPNFGESWSRLNAMAADTDYLNSWDGDVDSDGDAVANLQEVIKGHRISGNPYQYNIYSANSVPPTSIPSFASSTLSASGGAKFVTITYRPNEGPLSAASNVNVTMTPSGSGAAQTYAMSTGSTGFTYTYAVPAGATSVSYSFSSGSTTDTSGGAAWTASTSAGFVMDGEFDSQNFVVADNGMRIYAAIRGNKLYTATWSTKGGSNDHFIFVTDQFGNPVTHPWAKAGKVYGKFDFTAQTKPWIGANPDNAYANGFGAAGRNWLGDQGKALETEIDLVQVFGSVPRILYVAVGAYPRANGGALLSQAPASFGNVPEDIEIPEFQPVNTTSIRDEDLDGRFDAGNPEMIVSVNGNETDGNYGLRRFYLDEVAGDTAELTVKFRPNAGSATVSNVEVYTNLNRRDHAVLEEDPATVTTSSSTYFRAYAMSGPDSNGSYTATLPVNLCGAYRLQVRYKVAGVNSGNYIYYTDNGLRRDCAIVVSPKKALSLNMYEVNPLIVEAKDTTFSGRSTFLDLVNDPALPGESGGYAGRPDGLNKDHYSGLGVNMLWLQPIHPIGIDGRDINPETSAAFDPGSPYAVRDYWTVAPMLGRSNTEANATSEFQTFVSRLDSWGVGVMMDGTFNHSAPDAIMGQGAVDLGITSNGSQQIRNFNTGWYAKEGFPATPAATLAEIAIAPDRNDFGNWTDVREFFFGDYDALVKEKGTQNPDKSYPDNAYKLAFLLERDEFAGHTTITRQVWNYFAYYPIYWLEKSGHTSSTPKSQSHIGIDGLRCDFAQGLPSQFWEYAINKTRARKWDFLFMAESLDGARTVGNSSRHGVGYRSARHFDVLNENIVFYWRDTFFGYPANGGAGTAKNPNTFDTWKAYDDRRNAFDSVTLLNNLTSHDEVFPHNDVWAIAYGYAQVGALDGIPMLMYGQEAGAQNSKSAYGASEANFGTINASNNFAKYEANFGKNIPNFKVYNHMASIWNNRTSDEWRLQTFYGRVNRARLAAPALQSQNVYFLSQKQLGGGYQPNMFAVGKVQNLGQLAGAVGQSVVLTFVNNNYRSNPTVAATFDLNAKAPGSDLNYFGIDRGRSYNVKDLLADNSNNYVWTTNRTGADLIDNGLFVGLPNTNSATGSYQAQYLQLVDVSAPSLSFVPPQFMTYGTTNTLTSSTTPASTVTYTLVSGDTNKVSLSGNQLIINSGTGSIVVRATVAATADRGGVTGDATITFQKASQTITFDPSSTTASTSDPARTLIATSSSGLTVTLSSGSPGVASLIGNTLYFNSPGSAAITASQAGNDNYEEATSVSRTYAVTATSFTSLWGGQPANGDANGDGVAAILEYAFGGSPDSNNLGVLPQIARSNNTLSLTVLVRTNDTNLSVFPQASTSLSSNTWSSGGFNTNTSSNGVPDGFIRRTYTYDASNNTRAFLRLSVSNAP